MINHEVFRVRFEKNKVNVVFLAHLFVTLSTNRSLYMAATVFNPEQQHLLRMFAYDSSEDHLREIKEVLAAHFARKVDDEMDALYNEGKIDADMIEAWGKEHMRTPYK